ncbi:MAG: hypothetical protein ACRDYB_01035, partial [Acidimicrobiales bacterium]
SETGDAPTPIVPTMKEVTIPNPITTTAQPPPASTAPPNPANSPLGRYLVHPGQETSELVHHVLRVLDHIGHVVVLPVIAGIATLLVVWTMTKVFNRFRSSTDGHLVEVMLPATVDPKRAPVFWRNVHSVLAGRRRLAAPSSHVAFEMEGSSAGMRLRFFVAPGVPAMSVARAVGSAWPGAQCKNHEATSRALPGRFAVCGELRLAGPAWRSLWTEHNGDPLRSILGALGVEHGGAHAIVQVLVRPASPHQTRAIGRAVRSLHSGKPTALAPRLLAAWRTTTAAPPRPDPFRAAEVRHAVDKLSDLPAFEVVARYGVSTDAGDRTSRRRLRARGRELIAAFGVYAGDNHFVSRRRFSCRRRLDRRVFGQGQVLGISELAALAHLPYDEGIPGLTYAGAAAVAPPAGVSSGRGGFEEDDDAWL